MNLLFNFLNDIEKDEKIYTATIFKKFNEQFIVSPNQLLLDDFHLFKEIDFDDSNYDGTGRFKSQEKFAGKIYTINLKKGIYGPFYRYSPYIKLRANDEDGGFFTDYITNCMGCAKSSLWLFNKDRKYFYMNDETKKDKPLYKHKCYFDIKTENAPVLFIGKIAFGTQWQIRPNDHVFGFDYYEKGDKNENRIKYKLNPELLKSEKCNNCEAFCDFFENKY